jgi:NAD(P)H-binding
MATISSIFQLLSLLLLLENSVEALAPPGSQPFVAKLQPADHEARLSRRDWLSTAAASVTAASIFLPLQVQVADAESLLQPIAVLGANGRTGAHCVAACLSRGLPVLALTRSGSWSPPAQLLASLDNKADKLLSVAACDIKDATELATRLNGCRGVIYAASASKSGGNAAEIDYMGVVEAGKVCLAEKIPRYVVISSTATTRPKSLGYVFTNVMGGIMDQKRLGEQGVQASYQQATSSSTSRDAPSFTIIRPGGLEEAKINEVLGPKALEITQGDVLAGVVSRADLAEVAVELVISAAPNLRNTALELYYTESTVPVAQTFKSMMSSGVVPRLHGDAYSQLFQGIQPGIDFYAPS